VSADSLAVSTPESARLLAGVTVVEFAIEANYSRSLTSKLFADLGADVTVVRLDEPVKEVEVPDLSAPEQEWKYLLDLIGEGKRTVTLPGSDELAELVRGADIVLAPDAATAIGHGLDYESLAAISPTLVYGVATAFGDEDGADSWLSSDLVLQAMGGMLSTTGQPGEGPTKVGGRIAEHLGALYLGIGCVTGLIRRRRTGTGRKVSISLVEALASSLNNFVAEYRGKGHLPAPLGNRHLASSPWNTYKTSDGYVIICLITDRQWDTLAELMGHPELVGNPDFHGQQNRRPRADEIDALVTAWTETRTIADILAVLSERGVPCGDIRSTDEVLADETLVSRGMLSRAESGGIHLGPLVRVFRSVSAALDAAPVEADAFDALHASDPDIRPLAGLRVVEVGVAAAGPVCGRILANLGADVIKIEPAGGEIGRRVPPAIGSTSAVFQLNSNDKRSLCVDLTNDPGRTIAQRVIGTADVVVENMAPGRLVSWGLGFDEFATSNPGIIYTSVTGFGQGSTGMRLRAYDTVVQAASGLMSLTGQPGGIPTKAGISLSDFYGGVSGAFATIVALAARQSDRANAAPARSLHLDVAMHDVTFWTTMSSWPQFLLHGERPERRGNLDRFAFWQGVLTCDDGQIALTLHDIRDAKSLGQLVGSSAQLPVEGLGDEVIAALTGWAAKHSVISAVELLRSIPLAAGPVRSVIDLVEDKGLNARGVIAQSIHAVDGLVPVMNAPIYLSDVVVRVPRPSPILGEHTKDVLLNIANYSPAEVDELLLHPSVTQA
jgi:crotonobetainyl-CoA:carnitine CoA-transferase CaiB-like acyl-CoA transferase